MEQEFLSKIDQKLTDVSEKCKSRAATFLKKSKRYSFINTVLNGINISFTTATGVFASVSSEAETETETFIRNVSSIMLYTSAGVNAVQQFLNLESLAESSKTTAMRFSALYNNIVKYLYTTTNMDNKEYLKWALNEYEAILLHENIIDELTVVDNSKEKDILSHTDKSQPHYQYEIDRYAVNSFSAV